MKQIKQFIINVFIVFQPLIDMYINYIPAVCEILQ